MVASSDYLVHTSLFDAQTAENQSERLRLRFDWQYDADGLTCSFTGGMLEDLDPKYIQKQAKKATGLEARSSDLVYFQAYCNTSVFNSLTHSLTNYGIKIKHRWEEFCRYYQGLPILPAHVDDLNQRPSVISPLAAEGQLFIAEARSSDVPMLVHTTCMAGYNLVFNSLRHVDEFKWMREVVRRVYRRLHLPFVYPLGFEGDYADNRSICEPSFKTLGFSMSIRSSDKHVFERACDIAGQYTRYPCLTDIQGHFDYVLSGRIQLRDYSTYLDYWFDPRYEAIEIKTTTSDTKTSLKQQQLIDFAMRLSYSATMVYAQSDTDRVTELEAKLQEAEQEVTRLAEQNRVLKEKLDAMVMVYNRTVRKQRYRCEPCLSLNRHLTVYEDAAIPNREWMQARDHIAANILPHITQHPVRIYTQGDRKPICVETSKVCFARVASVSRLLEFQHMGRTFRTPQEWRAYYEPIIARLDSPDASA